MNKRVPQRERAVLVGVLGLPGSGNTPDGLDELAALADTAGAAVVDRMVQQRKRIDPATYIGKGKAAEVGRRARALDADTVMFDVDLSPGQIGNLSKEFKTRVIDRSTLIMDIFARHARTRESKIQVELAQLQYLLPRLTGHWAHFSRQVGGIGLRGPGETQLEVDRRLVRTRIKRLGRDLARIEQQRRISRRGRRDTFQVALIGYTNAGKSTLMNALTTADVPVANRLFATLDSTTRRLPLNTRRPVLLSDTVGFIRRLPPHLVASFQSTLGETREADLLLHVVDLSHPHYEEQIAVVHEVLTGMGISGKPTLTIFNKVDRVDRPPPLAALRARYGDVALAAAARNVGLRRILQRVRTYATQEFVEREVRVPGRAAETLAQLDGMGEVLERRWADGHLALRIRCPLQQAAALDRAIRALESAA